MGRATQMIRSISKGQLIPLTFTQHDVADSQSAVAMNRLEMAGRRPKFYVADGAAAGNVTVTGVATTDTLVFVGVFTTKASIATFADLTSEFSITATNTINNTSGTSTASNQLLVCVDRPNSVSDALTVTEQVIPFDFEVIAIDVVSNAARTAGTLTVDATVDGTVTGLQAVLDATNTTRNYAKQRRGTDVGNAGSRVGVKLTTASWTPITADVTVTAWVIAHMEGV
jgi:hypothetical protein